MRELSRRRISGWPAIAICAVLLCGSCSTVPEQSRLPRHVVFLWLKHPERTADRAQLIRAAHALQVIPGVTRVEAGRSAPDVGQPIDRSFDLAVVVTFRDAAALRSYKEDPRRRAAMKRYLTPLVRRYETYDLGIR